MKKIISLLISTFLSLSMFITVAYANDNNPDNLSDISISGDEILTSGSYDSEEILNYFPLVAPASLYDGSDYICNTAALESSDSVDFYPFSVSGTKSIIFRLISSNSDYAAILCPYDPTTGDISLTGSYVTAGGISAIADFNSDGQDDYCAVILNQGSTYGDSYTFAFNAKSGGGASEFINANGDLSNVVFRYGTTYKLNGENILDGVTDFKESLPEGPNEAERVYERNYEKYFNGGDYNICNVYLSSAQNYLGTMQYGTYTSTQQTVVHAIIIPITGSSYYCARSTSVDGRTTDSGTANGYLVYDITANEIVDWASELNFFYTIYYNETYSFSPLITSLN